MTKKGTFGQRSKTTEQRFWEKVSKGEDCWEWLSAFSSRGYGVFWKGREERSVFAHRYSYELAKGPIPEGMVIMHSCDNPRCVNPDHLSYGSIRDNALDAMHKGRLAEGVRNGGGRKLTEDQVREIWNTRKSIGCKRAATVFGVSSQTIKSIRNGRIWRSVTGAYSGAPFAEMWHHERRLLETVG